jgi:hypothetical protein
MVALERTSHQIIQKAHELKKRGAIERKKKADPNFWLEQDIDFLIRNYESLSCKEIARQLGVSKGAVTSKIKYLKRRNRLPATRKLRLEDFRQPELDFIKDNYLLLGPKECAARIHRSKKMTIKTANKMGLYFKYDWTPESEGFLRENFHRGSVYCAQQLGTTSSKVQSRLFKLKLSVKADPRVFSDIVTGFDHGFYLNFNNPIICYLMGIFWADGTLDTEKSRRFSLTLVKKDFLDILWMFSLAEGWRVKERHPKNRQTILVARCHNYTFLEFLENCDYLIKSGASADKILAHIPESLRHYWWRGYFDGDGWWTLDKGEKYGFGFSSTLDQNWFFAEKLIQQLGLTGHYISRRETSDGDSSEINCNNFDSALKFGNYIYSGYDTELTKIGLKRKYDKFLRLQAEKADSQKYYLKHRV